MIDLRRLARRPVKPTKERSVVQTMNQETSRRTLVGKRGRYDIEPATPLTYGRLSVLFASMSSSGEAVCVKLFRDQIEAADGDIDFERELQIVGALRHPSVLPLLDSGKSPELDDRPFLVMPLCRRGNLRSLLQTRSFLPPDEAMRYLRDVAAALDYSHGAGVIHGDVKPENILLSDDGRAMLCDFGAARYRLARSGVSTAVKDSFTELYAAPEQFAKGRHSVRSDVYSFATVAYELLTGRLPVEPTAPLYERMHAKVEGRLFPPLEANPLLPRIAADALMVALSTKPEDRPKSAGAVLLSIAGAVDSTARPVGATGDPGARVFVVHGRDEAAKERVARYLGSLGTKPVILHEQPSKGHTIIEKLEAYADVSAAVILLTPDDAGGVAGQPSQPRARQNVVFELGYFCGKLGRGRTIALYEPSVDLPSDFSGVVYILLDSSGAWRLTLARELRAAGLSLRLDSLIE